MMTVVEVADEVADMLVGEVADKMVDAVLGEVREVQVLEVEEEADNSRR